MKSGIYKDLPEKEYRSDSALCNSELQLFSKCASLYAWDKEAPQDPKKADTADLGSALHVMLLEPQNFEQKVMVSSVKGRKTKMFEDEVLSNPDKIVLTEEELAQLRVTELSCKANPMFNRVLSSKGSCETSIFVEDKSRDLNLKIRVDKIIDLSTPLFCDLKYTANIKDWRSDKEWINPLYEKGYGFTAAFYLYVGSLHYGVDLQEYVFPLAQKSVELGRYPATVFTIKREQLEDGGFWQEVQSNLDNFAEAYHSDNFSTFEYFEFL